MRKREELRKLIKFICQEDYKKGLIPPEIITDYSCYTTSFSWCRTVATYQILSNPHNLTREEWIAALEIGLGGECDNKFIDIYID